MSIKFWGLITVIIFVAQITFSIHYSLNIVDQNELVNQLQKKLNQEKLKNEILENKLATINSLVNIRKSILDQTPIRQAIDLK